MTTSSKNQPQLFLDSSTILGRIFRYELYYCLCEQILGCSLIKYSSETAVQEINLVIERRKKLYNKLQLAKARGAKEKALKRLIRNSAISKNDIRFLEELKRQTLENGSNTHWIQAFRLIIQYAEDQLPLTLENEICSLISKKEAKRRLISLNNLIKNESDSQILIDMIEEFKNGINMIHFITQDYKDFVEKRNEIKFWFKNQYGIEPFFEILSVNEGALLVNNYT